ncbi:DUF5916 domain-containing protein [Flectobacillus major]|uniref:DUF5916 domain-containing protein n=1 Tax=Flectobacillus major TaxID=103 RepID=UPI0004089A32|nr:DUF5916 domain-containing protein [Flectobacillus major]
MKKTLLILSFLIFHSTLFFAQKINESVQYHIKPTTSKIVIDGNLDDAAWSTTEVGNDFWMITPNDTSKTNAQTEFRMTYDDQFLYVAAICHEKIKNKTFVVESLKRDFSFGNNDNLWLILEPFNDLTNGFVFGANAAGAQFDGIISEGTNLNANWDNKWYSETKYLGDKWILEMAIPFKTLRYKAGETRWGLNFSRLDLKSNEKSSWARIPRQFFSITLAYTGVLVWDTPPPTPKNNISIIPYALGGINKNYSQNTDASWRKDIGVDAKVAVSSALNLDLTVNPDFSQVDVDQQVTNLDRFELFFPERRQFFLENSDLFNNFGFKNIRPFFSRRIGLGVPIRFGARLSGKINNNLRIGLMNMQTGAIDDENRPAQNFSTLVLQQKVFSRSNIGIMFLNKESINFDEKAGGIFTKYNRNIGLEYNLASPSNLWTGKALFLKSFSPLKTNTSDEYVQALNVAHNGKNWVLQWQHEYVGKSYNPEVGYVPRVGYFKIDPVATYLFYPKNSTSPIFAHGPTAESVNYWNMNSKLTDNTNILAYAFQMKNRSSLSVWTATDFVKLQFKFNPMNPYSKAHYVSDQSEHSWRSAGLDYLSTPKKLLTYSVSTRVGGYYGDGKRMAITGLIGYRFQPYVSLSVGADYNNIKDVTVIDATTEETTRQSTEFWLVRSKVDITFTNNLFWTTYFQYNEQQKNVNLNTRLQWRYKPASDLFLVYTDNYVPNSFGIKDRALVLKLTYWWNV